MICRYPKKGSDSGKVLSPKLFVVLWLFWAIAVCFHGNAFADEVSQQPDEEKFRWHVRAGMQMVHQLPDFRYVPDKPTGVTAWNSNRDISRTSFSFFSLQRELDDSSSIELSYFSDGTGGKVYGTTQVKYRLFNRYLYLYPIVREPLEIDVRTLRLTYSRAIWQPQPFSLGASVSVQALQVSMNASLPPLFRSMAEDDHFNYLVVTPSLGAFAEYRTNGPLSYRVSSAWMSTPLGDIEGKLVEVNAQAEYRLSNQLLLGVGYRFADRNVQIHQKRYDLKGSYEVHGYQMYAGFDF